MASKLKNVISVSRRTDIPAYYMNWFLEKVKTGYVEVQNPFYPDNWHKVNLKPESVGWIVFWSRNYKRYLENKDIFEDYNTYFHFTINCENDAKFSNNIPLKLALKQCENLISSYGSQRLMWRFDPIFLCENYSNYSSASFQELCKIMSDIGVKSCTISFAQIYKKVKNRILKRQLDLVPLALSTKDKEKIAKYIRDVCSKYDIDLFCCCDNDLLKIDKIKKGRCINGEFLNSLDNNIKVSEAKYPSRKFCGCTKSVDIGSYKLHPCLNNCIYCYANTKF